MSVHDAEQSSPADNTSRQMVRECVDSKYTGHVESTFRSVSVELFDYGLGTALCIHCFDLIISIKCYHFETTFDKSFTSTEIAGSFSESSKHPNDVKEQI